MYMFWKQTKLAHIPNSDKWMRFVFLALLYSSVMQRNSGRFRYRLSQNLCDRRIPDVVVLDMCISGKKNLYEKV